MCLGVLLRRWAPVTLASSCLRQTSYAPKRLEVIKAWGYLPYAGANPAKRLAPHGWKRGNFDNLDEPARASRTSLWWDTSSLIVSTRLSDLISALFGSVRIGC
jgi:hypothetical protein